MTPPRVFLDSSVLIEGLVAPWSASRGVLILGRASLITFVLAEIVLDETERGLAATLGSPYGGPARLSADFRILLQRLRIERVPHVSRQEFNAARHWIRHRNDVPVLAAAVKARPDWLLTDNTSHSDDSVAEKTGLAIATPAQFLLSAGRILSL